MKSKHSLPGFPLLLVCYLFAGFFFLFSPAAGSDLLVVKGDSNYPPYEYLNEKNQPEGFNVDITRAVARVMGLDLSIELGRWDVVRAELEQGKIDALMGMFQTEERDRRAEYSETFGPV